MVTKRKRVRLYPKRIAGISFREEDHSRIQAVCKNRGLSEAQVIRGAVAAGLSVYESGLQRSIAEAAAELGESESSVVRGAIEEGFDEFLRIRRSHQRITMLEKLRGELGEGEEDLKSALGGYLEKLIREEKSYQKKIEMDDEQQEEEDRELQQDAEKFEAVLNRQGRSDRTNRS